MSSAGRHYDAEIQDLLDGRLTAAARSEVESHLEACAECRHRLQVLRWTRRAAARAGAEHQPPEALAGDVARLLDAEDRKRGGHGAAWRPRSLRAAWAAAALLVLTVAGAWLLLRRPAARDVPAQVADDYHRHRAGELRLEVETSRPEDAEALFRRRGLGFRTRVFDLAMMGYQVAGARVHEVSGRPSALFTYRGPGGEVLLCQMYEGEVTELPAGAERRLHDGIEFLIYRRGALTLVFWQEGDVICVLVSDIAPEAVVALAFAKAVKP
jgi:anti-sigma factor RsiW